MSQIRVLVVDEDAEFREAAVLEMEGHGLVVRQAESVDEALELLEAGPFELVLTELFFSGRPQGHRLLATIRRHDLAAYVVVLTRELDTSHLLDCMHAGAMDYLAKPFRWDPIEQIIGKLRATAGRQLQPNQPATARILVLESDWVLRDRYHDILASHGYTIVKVPQEEDLVGAVHRQGVDLVLMDHAFGGPKSMATAYRLKTSTQTGHIPLIITGGPQDHRTIVESFQAGANDYLAKPVDATDLVLRVRRLTEWKQSHDDLRLAMNDSDRKRQVLTTETLFYKQLNRHLDLEEKIDIIQRELPPLLGVQYFAILGFDQSKMQLTLLAHNITQPPTESVIDVTEDQAAHDCIRLGKPIVLNRPGTGGGPGPFTRGLDVNNHFCLPLTVGRRIWGVIHMINVSHEDLTGEYGEMAGRVLENLTNSLENAQLYAETKRLAVIDGLTGLNNHNTMVRQISFELERVARYKTQVSVVMFDIDDFKLINDKYGHPQGDSVLVETAQLVTPHIRTVDQAARYGGEEFLIILPDTPKNLAVALAQRIHVLVKEKNFTPLDGHSQIRLTISVGVGTAPADATTYEQLLRIVDDRLYKAKRSGKNQVVWE